MSLRSATELIRALNSRNTSGVIPQALELIANLERVRGNPPMIQAVGAQNLVGMLNFILNIFKQKSKYQQQYCAANTQNTQTQREELRINTIQQEANTTANTANTTANTAANTLTIPLCFID